MTMLLTKNSYALTPEGLGRNGSKVNQFGQRAEPLITMYFFVEYPLSFH
jgi:hypothetical protein